MTDWESAYANDDTPWDKGTAAPPLIEFLSKHVITGEVLVPGCGAGHDVRLIAEVGASVVGMDLAPSAVQKADAIQTVNNEQYAVGDFLNLCTEWQSRFDWVVEHTCLCALDLADREAYVSSVARALKESGHYLAVFYREVSDYDGDGPPHPISVEQIETLFGELFERVDSFVPTQSYPSRPTGSEEVVLFRKRG
ncbi:MAG: methyltransferase domain-containing protein [Opitutaceae bacterium]